MEALRFQLSSASLTSTIPASTLQHSHSRHFLSSVQLGRVGSSPAIGAVSNTAANKICTADELHYVPVPNSDWRVALWRYLPSPKVPIRYIYACICVCAYICIAVCIYVRTVMFICLTGTEEETSFAPIVWDCNQCFYIRSFPWGNLIIFKQLNFYYSVNLTTKFDFVVYILKGILVTQVSIWKLNTFFIFLSVEIHVCSLLLQDSCLVQDLIRGFLSSVEPDWVL